MDDAKVAHGLEGVVVAETRLSRVDGERGELVLAGYRVQDLARERRFEEVVGLFLDGALPAPSETSAIARGLGRARAEAFERLPALGDALGAENAMDALRAATSHVRPSANGGSEGLRADAIRLAGAIPVFAAAWWRARAGATAVPPDAGASHASDALRMITGDAPDDRVARAFDAYLVTVVDHGMNASTFAARVVASTASDVVSSVVAALGALKGPLHGGAPGPVLDMLDAVGDPTRARSWLETELEAGRRIMGMGHRVYRVRDPRAAVLEREVSELAAAGGSTRERLALARAVEEQAHALLRDRHPDRPMGANVELYTALVLEAVGLPRQLFTPAFAAARVIGWCAHVAEQQATGRLLRPRSRYVGPAPG